METHLSELGKSWKYGVWIPYELSPHQLRLRVDTCMALMTSHHNYPWLHNLITGDEKWVLYVNHTRKHQWLETRQTGIETPQNDRHQRRIMLNVWWSVRRATHWELLSNGCNITTDLYCQQLDRVAAKLQGQQDRVYFLLDNARPHVARPTQARSYWSLDGFRFYIHHILLTWLLRIIICIVLYLTIYVKKIRRWERPQNGAG